MAATAGGAGPKPRRAGRSGGEAEGLAQDWPGAGGAVAPMPVGPSGMIAPVDLSKARPGPRAEETTARARGAAGRGPALRYQARPVERCGPDPPIVPAPPVRAVCLRPALSMRAVAQPQPRKRWAGRPCSGSRASRMQPPHWRFHVPLHHRLSGTSQNRPRRWGSRFTLRRMGDGKLVRIGLIKGEWYSVDKLHQFPSLHAARCAHPGRPSLTERSARCTILKNCLAIELGASRTGRNVARTFRRLLHCTILVFHRVTQLPH